jgi:hypothetical protein
MSNQDVFYALLDKYNNALEPLSNWTTADLVALVDAADMELQNRAPPDSVPNHFYDEKGGITEISDDDY